MFYIFFRTVSQILQSILVVIHFHSISLIPFVYLLFRLYLRVIPNGFSRNVCPFVCTTPILKIYLFMPLSFAKPWCCRIWRSGKTILTRFIYLHPHIIFIIIILSYHHVPRTLKHFIPRNLNVINVYGQITIFSVITQL